MSYSNFRIKRICKQCASEFEAQKVSTQYCSALCAKRAYKIRMRKGNVEKHNKETELIKTKPTIELKAKEFLTVKDAAKLLNSSRQMVYDLIKKGTVKAINLSIKKTLIQRSEIDKLFSITEPVKLQPEPIQLNEKDCYNMQEIQRKYKISEAALYQVIKRNQIPKFKKGWYSYVPKTEIDKLFSNSTIQ